ncbi:class II glutamine amidotransferase [Candidatus Woesearchaeota archaeon]|nr:class II glutamine amidotransferase [Candidatus Woesearchaeota archaeon]
MCRLFAVSSASPVALDSAFLDFINLSEEHPDGWGLAFWNKDKLTLVKEPTKAKDSSLPAKLIGTKSTLILAHLRKSSVGNNCYTNTHPFVFRINGQDWVFAHNGTLYHEKTKGDFLEKAKNKDFTPLGETDSEHFFAFVASRILDEGEQNIPAILKNAIADIMPFHRFDEDGGLNFLLTNGETLYVFRKNRSLFYSAENNVITICSQPLNTPHWTEIPEDTLFLITNGKMTPLHTR